jgi:hypothetical protein
LRGEVLHYDEAQGFGFFADGNATPSRGEPAPRVSMAKGTSVEFQPGGGQARDISIAAQNPTDSAAPKCPTAPTSQRACGRSTAAFRSAAEKRAPANHVCGDFWHGVTENYFNFADAPHGNSGGLRPVLDGFLCSSSAASACSDTEMGNFIFSRRRPLAFAAPSCGDVPAVAGSSIPRRCRSA